MFDTHISPVDLFQAFASKLQPAYDSREAENITSLVFEELFALKKVHLRLVNRTFSEQETKQLEDIANRLMLFEPVQQILGYAFFYKYKFKVNRHVLIPRPETEELVEHVVKAIRQFPHPVSVIDIGTGSGCIAISVKKECPSATVYALDISSEALLVARENAQCLRADIGFLQMDILDETATTQLPEVSIVVSNPPYIAQSEAASMFDNVLAYEPHQALFVPDSNPLVFYSRLAALGIQKGASVFVEINERLGKETVAVFKQAGFASVDLIKDMQGKDRMVIARL